MEIKYGSPEAKSFVTNLSLVTSRGKWGDNVMTAEWVHHISYNPGLIMVNVHDFDATADNILETKEFGISIAATDQGDMISISGGSTGKEIDKIAVLKDLGFEFYKAKKIGVQMVKGAALNLECKLVKHEKVGDHIMFIGEVVEASVNAEKESLAFRAATGIYKLDNRIPHDKEAKKQQKIEELLQKHRKGY
jgi:flavin reductase (DIM6/NTAB) family NADH-FMN oxidoreductase RutF